MEKSVGVLRINLQEMAQKLARIPAHSRRIAERNFDIDGDFHLA
jgi:hypothetical protein